MTIQELYLRYEPVLKPVLRIGPLFGGVALLAWRVRETRVPLTVRAIVLPPLAMSTGFFMFFSPLTHVSWAWAMAAFLLGLLVLAWPLVRSSRLTVRDGTVYMQRSRAFLWILLGLLAVRLLLHDYVGHLISPLQTASLFYLMAFGMIVHWRVAMYLQFRRITASAHATEPRPRALASSPPSSSADAAP
ncbi:MAG: cytochrome c biogenesis protein CcdC [Gemmatimonadetes bacterium]|nr:cytochrome c biogenesis protein CcdC [Gemmatimonadota bacterium]